MKLLVHTAVLLLFFASCKKGKNNPEACNGDTRREVKLLIDAAAPAIDTTVIDISLTAIGELDVPEVKSETDRQDIEKKIYRVRAEVDKVKKEPDGDWHIRLKDGDNYLITECPNPDCTYAEGSSYVNTYKQIKAFIEANDLEGKTVTITGVGFVDIDHYYARKQAKNNMELHPILSITF